MLSRLRVLARDQRGAMLMETVVAIMIFGVVGTAVLSGVSMVMRSGQKTDVQSYLENIARSQMEDTFNQAYQNPPFTYPSYPAPGGYTVTSQAEEYVLGDSNIEKITVTVSYSGSPDYVVETLRTR